eukprot:11033171-Karenia_brevis.AAC.1
MQQEERHFRQLQVQHQAIRHPCQGRPFAFATGLQRPGPRHTSLDSHAAPQSVPIPAYGAR